MGFFFGTTWTHYTCLVPAGAGLLNDILCCLKHTHTLTNKHTHSDVTYRAFVYQTNNIEHNVSHEILAVTRITNHIDIGCCCFFSFSEWRKIVREKCFYLQQSNSWVFYLFSDSICFLSLLTFIATRHHHQNELSIRKYIRKLYLILSTLTIDKHFHQNQMNHTPFFFTTNSNAK